MAINGNEAMSGHEWSWVVMSGHEWSWVAMGGHGWSWVGKEANEGVWMVWVCVWVVLVVQRWSSRGADEV